MGTTQQFCLKWNNHQSNMLSIFDQLLSSEHFVDVTLACDGLSVKAHKMVLSACSPFFQTLFIQNPCDHPIVILKDIRYIDLKALVQFMYRGEVNVSQDQLPTLLKAAETLKIKGLAEVTNDNQSSKPTAPILGGIGINNGHHVSANTLNSSLTQNNSSNSASLSGKANCSDSAPPSIQAAVASNALAQAVHQQNALKAIQVAQHVAQQQALAVAAAAAAQQQQDNVTSHINSNASTPLRQTDSPMSQQNRKRRRKSASSDKGSGDEASALESGGEDNGIGMSMNMDDTRQTDDESAAEENEFEPSKLLEQSMTEVRNPNPQNQDNNSSSSDQTKDGSTSQTDTKPLLNFESTNATGALSCDAQAVLALAAAAQAAGANPGDSSVAGPSQPTHASSPPLPIVSSSAAALSLVLSDSCNDSSSNTAPNTLIPTNGITSGSQPFIPTELLRQLFDPIKKQFVCPFCLWSSSEEDKVQAHIATHTNDPLKDKDSKRYRCRFCPFASKQKGNLLRHERIHTGEKPYSCDMCDYKSHRGDKITAHKLTIHKVAASPSMSLSSSILASLGSPGSLSVSSSLGLLRSFSANNNDHNDSSSAII